MSADRQRGQRRDGDSRSQGTLRPMHISLRSGERLFLNGAVLKVDRKVTLELLNDATFLLENHVLQVEDTNTPLRQLYFAAQAMLMDPQNATATRALFQTMAADMKRLFASEKLRNGVEEAERQVSANRPFHALKTLRGLFAAEAEVLGETAPHEKPAAPTAATTPCAVRAGETTVTAPEPDVPAIAAEQATLQAGTNTLQ